MRSPLVAFTLIVMAITVPIVAAQKVELSIDASKTGAKIDHNIFGQFAEHLGHGIYEGIWVGFLSASLLLRGKQSSSLRPGQTSKSHASGGTRSYPEIKQAMRVLGNSTFNEPFDVVALTPRSTGYSTVGSGIVQGTSVFAGPSILQIASRVRLCDRIPKATGFCESVASGSPSG